MGTGGCEDVYGVGTNDSVSTLGPRSEISAHTGIWQRCGSIFDTNCDGVPNSTPPFSGPTDSRRMSVLETDLQVAGAQYFADGWYVVRDDNNIFNTMAYRIVTPTLTTNWTFPPVGNHTYGPVIDAWVNPANPGPNADTRRIDTRGGRLTLAVRATGLPSGRWRYDYALMNHDYDAGITSISVPLPAGTVVTNAFFHDVDRNASTDWVATITPGAQIRWQSPNAAARLPWGLLFTFSFEVDAAPTGGAVVKLDTPAQAPMALRNVSILGPVAR